MSAVFDGLFRIYKDKGVLWAGSTYFIWDNFMLTFYHDEEYGFFKHSVRINTTVYGAMEGVGRRLNVVYYSKYGRVRVLR